MSATISISTSYNSLVNEVAALLYGLRTVSNDDSTNVIDTSVVSPAQGQDILRCVSKGLRAVYYPGSYIWSFLRPIVYINTVAPYATGTIIIDASGNVTLTGGTFPSNAASAFGQVSLVSPVPPTFNGGSWLVGMYNSGSSVALANYTGPMLPASLATAMSGSTSSGAGTTFTWGTPTTATVGQYVVVYAGSGAALGSYLITAVSGTTSVTISTSPGANLSSITWSLSATAGVAYTLSFNHYVLPAGTDGFEKHLTFPSDGSHREHTLPKTDEQTIRRMLQRNVVPRRPEVYAITSSTYVQTTLPASTRYVTFYPAPSAVYTLYGKAIIRPLPLDATNKYPIGDELLGGVFEESCLAAAEVYIQERDGMHPDGVHCRAFPPMLAAAIAQDKIRAAPETLGIDYGHGEDEHHSHRRGGAIFMQIGGLDQWIGS